VDFVVECFGDGHFSVRLLDFFNGHIRDIHEKLHVNTRGAAVAKAIKEGLTK